MPILKFEVEADYEKVIRLREEIDRLETTLRGFGPGASDRTLENIKSQIASCTAEFQRLTTQAAAAGASVEKSIRSELGKVQKNQQVNIKMQADNTQFHNAMLESNRDFQEVMQNIDSFQSQLSGAFSKLSSLAGFSVPLYSAFAFLNKVKDTRSYFQDVESTMQVMLGSQEKALDFTKKLQDYAYYNMFEYSDLVGASKQMLAYGVSVDQVIPRLNTLSEVATATKQPIQEIVGMYNRAKSIGYVDSRALQTWASNGLVVKDVLAEMGERGVGTRVTFEQLNKALDHVTAEGGKFHGVMDAQMQNISAEIGQLEDNMSLMYNEIGEKLQEPLRKVIKVASELVDNWKAVGAVLLSAGAGYAMFTKARSISAASLRKEQEALRKSLSDLMVEEDTRQKEINRLIDEGVVSKERAVEMQKQLNIAKREEQKIDRAVKAGLISEQEGRSMKTQVETARLNGILSESGFSDEGKMAELQKKRQSLLGESADLKRSLGGLTAEADLREVQINARLKEGLIDRKTAVEMQNQLNIAKQKELEIEDALSRGLISRQEAESMKTDVEMARQQGILGKTDEELRKMRQDNVKAQEDAAMQAAKAEAEEQKRLAAIQQQNEELREQTRILEANNNKRKGGTDISEIKTTEITDKDLLEKLDAGADKDALLDLQHQRNITDALIKTSEESRNKLQSELDSLDKKAVTTYKNLANAKAENNTEMISSFESEWDKVQKERESVVRKLVNENDRLNTLNSEKEGELTLKQKIGIREDDLLSGQQRSKTLRDEATALRDSIPALDEKIAKEKEEIRLTKEHIEQLEKKYKAQQEIRANGGVVPEDEDVTTSLEDEKSYLEERKKEKKKLESERKGNLDASYLREQNAISQDMQNAQMQKDINDMRTSGYSDALKVLDDQIGAETDKVHELDAKIAKLKEERKNILTSDIADKQELIDKNTADLDSAFSERQSTMHSIGANRRKRRELTEESGMENQSQKESDDYESSLKGKVEEQDKSIKAIDEQIAKSKELLEVEQKQLEAARQRTDELKKQVDDLPEGDTSQGAQDLNVQLGDAVQQEQEALQKVDALHEQINTKTQERKDMQEELAAMMTDMEIADSESLAESMDSVTESLQEAEDALQGESQAEQANAAAKTANEAVSKGQVTTNAAKAGSEVAETASVRAETGAEVANTGAKKTNTLATRLSIVWDRLKKNAVNEVTRSLKGMWAAMMANPIMAVVSLVTTAITAFMSFKAAAEDTPTPEMNEFGESALTAKNKVESLFAVMQATEKESSAHKKAVAELERQYKDKNIVLDATIDKEKEMIKNKERLIELIMEEGRQNQIANKVGAIEKEKENAQEQMGKKIDIKGKNDSVKAKIEASKDAIEVNVMEYIEKNKALRDEIEKLFNEQSDLLEKLEKPGNGMSESERNAIFAQRNEIIKQYSAKIGQYNNGLRKSVTGILSKQGLNDSDYNLNWNKLVKGAEKYAKEVDTCANKATLLKETQEQLALSGNKMEGELNVSTLAVEQLAKGLADAQMQGKVLAETKVDPPVGHTRIDEVVEAAIKAGGYINALGEPVKLNVNSESVDEGSNKTDELQSKLDATDNTSAYPTINDASIQNALDKLGQVQTILNSINGTTYFTGGEKADELKKLENLKDKDGNPIFKDGKWSGAKTSTANVKKYEKLWSEIKASNYLAGNEKYKIGNAYEYAIIENARKNFRNKDGVIDRSLMDEATRKAYEDVIYNIHLRSQNEGKTKNDAVVQKHLDEASRRYGDFKNMKDGDFDEAKSFYNSYKSNFTQTSKEYQWAEKKLKELNEKDKRNKKGGNKGKSAEEIKYNADKMVKEELQRRKRMSEDLYFTMTEVEIDMMDDGSAKEIAQLRLNHKKKLQELERQKEDEIKKRKQNMIQLWLQQDKSGKRKEYQFFNDQKNLDALNALEAEVAKDLELESRITLADEKLKEDLNEISDKSLASLREFIKAYGDYESKVKAIGDLYRKQMEETTDAVAKMELKKKWDDEVSELASTKFIEELNLESVFDTLDERSLSSLERLEKNLKESFEKGIADGIPFDKLEVLRDKIKEIKNLIQDRKDQWSDILPDIAKLFVKPKQDKKRKQERYEESEYFYQKAEENKKNKQGQYEDALSHVKDKAKNLGLSEYAANQITMDNVELMRNNLSNELYRQRDDAESRIRNQMLEIGREDLDKTGLTRDEAIEAVKSKYGENSEEGDAIIANLNSSFNELEQSERNLTSGMLELANAIANLGKAFSEKNEADKSADREKRNRDNAYELSPENLKKQKEDAKKKREEARKAEKDAEAKQKASDRANKQLSLAEKDRDNALNELNKKAAEKGLTTRFDKNDVVSGLLGRKLLMNGEMDALKDEEFQNIFQMFLGKQKMFSQASGAAQQAASAASGAASAASAAGEAAGAAEGATAAAGGGGGGGGILTDTIIHTANATMQSTVKLNEELGLQETAWAKGMESFAESSQYATDAFDSLKSGDLVGTAANLIGAFRTLGDALGKWGIGIFGSSDVNLHDDMEHLARVEEKLTSAVEGLTKKMNEKDTTVTEMLEYYYMSQEFINKEVQNNQDLLKRAMGTYNQGLFGIGGKKSANTKVDKEFEDDDWRKIELATGRKVRDAEDLTTFSAEDWYNLSIYDPETLVKLKEVIEKGEEGEAAIEYIEKLIEAGEDLEEVTRQVQQNLTQTTFEGVADNFKSTLMNMSNDSYAFADNFQQMMKEAVINGMMQEEYNKALQDWYKNFADAMASGKQLTTSEQNLLKDEYMAIVDSAVEKRDALMNVMGWEGDLTQQSTRGAIAQMSQDTGDAIEGRMTAIQMAVESIRGYEQENNSNIAVISDNILQMMMQGNVRNNHFENMEEQIARCYMELQAINDNTASLQTPLGNMQTDLAEIKRAIKNL